MKQKGGKFQSNYKMEHISNINGVVKQNKIIAKGNDSGINIITQKNNNNPEHVFIKLDQFVNKLDRGEKDLFSKLNKLMNDENHNHPLILQKPLNTLDKLPSKLPSKLKRRRAKKRRKASKGNINEAKKKRKTNKKWKKKKNKTLKRKNRSLFDEDMWGN